MRPHIRKFVRLVSGLLPLPEPIYEFGSYLLPGQAKLADLRPLFTGRRFVGTDVRPGPGVDRVLDIQKIRLPAASVGTVLALDTLEHVPDPVRAMQEVRRILKPGGIVVISSVMFFPIHDYPYDYWRFTPDAFRNLLKPFAASWVGQAGDPGFPHTVAGVGFRTKPQTAVLKKFTGEMARRRPLKGGWKELALLLVPAIVAMPLYRAFFRKG